MNSNIVIGFVVGFYMVMVFDVNNCFSSIIVEVGGVGGFVLMVSFVDFVCINDNGFISI